MGLQCHQNSFPPGSVGHIIWTLRGGLGRGRTEMGQKMKGGRTGRRSRKVSDAWYTELKFPVSEILF